MPAVDELAVALREPPPSFRAYQLPSELNPHLGTRV
jgi:hypothetical protein